MDEFSFEIIELILYAISALASAIIGAIAIIFNRKRVRKKMETLDYSEHKEKRKRNYTRNYIIDEQITTRIKEKDKSFDEIAFKEWAKDTFVKFQNAWSNKNMISISSRLDKNLCEQYQLLIDTNIEKDCTNIIDIKQVNFVDFSAYSNDNEKEIIEVAINVVVLDYAINNLTQKIVNGSKTIKNRTTYKLNFYRKFGTQTDETKNQSVCPNCGAKISSGSNRCEYCKTWVLNGMKEWILNSIEKY